MALDADRARAIPFDPLTVQVERGALAFFAKSTGQRDPVYSDPAAARRAGYPDVPVPPTYFFGLELALARDAFAYLGELGIEKTTILHGEQSFTYHSMAYAGQTLTLRPRIVDAFSKKDGALQFVVKRTDIVRDGEVIAEAESVIVARPGVSEA